MYAEDDAITVDDLSHCSDIQYTAALADQSTSHFISEGFVQYAQPTYDGALVELYPAHSSVDVVYPPQMTNNYGYNNTNTFNWKKKIEEKCYWYSMPKKEQLLQ